VVCPLLSAISAIITRIAERVNASPTEHVDDALIKGGMTPVVVALPKEEKKNRFGFSWRIERIPLNRECSGVWSQVQILPPYAPRLGILQLCADYRTARLEGNESKLKNR